MLPANPPQRSHLFSRKAGQQLRLAALEEKQGVLIVYVLLHPPGVGAHELDVAAPVFIQCEFPESGSIAPDDLDVSVCQLADCSHDHLGAAGHALQFVRLSDEQPLTGL
jgi:hypothetical protein